MASCRDFELDIVDYLDGTLTGPRLAALEAHLAECPDCVRRVEDMRRIVAATASLETEPPAVLHEAIMARVDAAAEKPGHLLRFPLRRAVGIAAAVFVLVCAAAVGTRLLGRKGAADTAAAVQSLERMQSTENRALFSAGTAGPAEIEMEESAEEAEADMAVEVPADYDAETPDEVVPEEAAEEESAPLDVSLAPDAEPTENEDPVGDGALFDALGNRNARYCAVVVFKTPELPEDTAGLPDGAEHIFFADRGAEEEAYCAAIPARDLSVWLQTLGERYGQAVRYDSETPGQTGALLDPAAEEALVILRRAD